MATSVSKSLLILTGLMVWTLSGAQTGMVVNSQDTRSETGKFSASLESNSICYFNDAGLGVTDPEDKFGSNSYLKMDYVKGRISAGLQIGFEMGQQPDSRKLFLASKYIRWENDMFSFHVGDIYDQMGNGLIFRTYEDRNLGFNNSLEGFQTSMNLNNWFTVKGTVGRPRLYTSYADSWVRGATAAVYLNEIFGWDGILLGLEGNFLNRYESLENGGLVDFASLGMESGSMNSCSAALNFAWNGLTFKAEYAAKSKDLYSVNATSAHKGAAIYSEATYGTGRFSAAAHFRILDHMGTMSSLYGNGTGNSLSYLPALTRQGRMGDAARPFLHGPQEPQPVLDIQGKCFFCHDNRRHSDRQREQKAPLAGCQCGCGMSLDEAAQDHFPLLASAVESKPWIPGRDLHIQHIRSRHSIQDQQPEHRKR